MTRLILFLIRKRLGVKKEQKFYFSNQANKGEKYYFTDEGIVKEIVYRDYVHALSSNIRLNFLISDEAKRLIVKD